MRIQHRAHAQAASMFARRGRMLAVAALVLSTIVGTSIFATLDGSPSTGWRITTGLISLVAAVLAALQAFLSYPELAERHRRTSLRIGALRHRMDQLAIRGSRLGSQEIDEIRVKWDDVLSEAPPIPQRLNTRAEEHVRASNETRRGRGLK